MNQDNKGKVPSKKPGSWKCEITQLGSQKDLKVADKFYLSCSEENDFKEKFKTKPSLLIEDKGKEFALNILNVKSDDHQKKVFLATSYRAGDHKNLQFTITDGKVKISSQVSLSIKSILKSDSKPIGPLGPMTLPYSSLFWSSLAAFLVILLSVIMIFFARLYKWKNALKDLEFSSPEAAYKEYYKQTRALLKKQKKVYTLEELKTEFHLFLAQTFRMPFHKNKWDRMDLKKRLSKKNPHYFQKHNKELFQFLEELSHEKECDFDSLSEMIYRSYYISEDIIETMRES